MYRWESKNRYSVETYEDENDVVVDYVDEAEICSELMWNWGFESEEEAFHYAQDFMEYFDESVYSEP
jgi:hypothetical protein